MMNNFGEWLRQEVTRRGWRVSELARRAGMSTSTLSNILTGKKCAGAVVCRGVAAAFVLPEEAVFRQAGLLSPATPDAYGDRIVELLRALSVAEQREIYEYAQYRLYRQKK